jgi:hypothetical protein
VREKGQGLLTFGSVFRGFRKFYVHCAGGMQSVSSYGKVGNQEYCSKKQIAGYETWEKLVL